MANKTLLGPLLFLESLGTFFRGERKSMGRLNGTF